MSWRRTYGSISPGRVKMWYFWFFLALLWPNGQGLASDHQTDALVREIKGWKERRVLHIMTLRPMSSCQCQCQCQWGMGKVLHQTDALVQEMKGWKERRVTRWITDLGSRSYTTQTCTLSRPPSICIKTNNQTRRTHGNEGRCKGKKRQKTITCPLPRGFGFQIFWYLYDIIDNNHWKIGRETKGWKGGTEGAKRQITCRPSVQPWTGLIFWLRKY